MITPFDDYPIHQTAASVTYPATGDRGYYDGCFFNGCDRDGEFFFAIAMGIYPNRMVTDASFSVVHAGERRGAHASARAPIPGPASSTATGPAAFAGVVLTITAATLVGTDAADLLT